MNDRKYLIVSIILFAVVLGAILLRSSMKQVPEPVKEEPLLIDINSASSDELCRLPGIGEKTAGDIIEYRNSNKGFQRIKDLMNVPGIKEKRFESLKEFVYVKDSI